ncbi:EF-hand domain-containing protein [Aeoliella mucimassa]|uniref:hypothetical protein n=1 Tax=Aeoliella mucimassa TaxID=2527972 RepID=UPI001E5C82EC|nr:hypothetical protein [Aeoliella mucimassa]
MAAGNAGWLINSVRGDDALKESALKVQAACVGLLLVVTGCGGMNNDDWRSKSVNVSSAASSAFEKLDTNGDGQLDSSELESCPALRDSLQLYDSSGDGNIAKDELESRLSTLFASDATLANITCTVLSSNRPVAGATVNYAPVEFLADVLSPAQGTTDSAGIARLTYADADLPSSLQGRDLMLIGLYNVTITAGGETKTCGHEANSSSREGVNPTFDLKKL